MMRHVPPPRQPLQNVAWLVGERIGRAALTATVLACVARHLEPAGFGRLNFALTTVLIAQALAFFGLEGVVVNELVRQPDRTGAILGTAVRLRLLSGAATALALNGIAWAAPSLRADAGLLGIMSLMLLLQPAEVVDLWFQRHLDSRRTVVSRLVAIVAGATLKLWLVAANAPLTAFAWALVADAVFVAICLTWAARRSAHSSGPWVWDPGLARFFLRRGAPLAIAALASTLTLRLDQVLVRQWLGETEAGLYFASARLIELASFAGAAVVISLFPGLSASHARSPEEFRARLDPFFGVLSALGWITALGCTLAGPWVIDILYGPAYAGAAAILAWQGWACLLALNSLARGSFILLSASTFLPLATAGLHVITLFGAAFFLVPRWGTPGAAAALVVANLVSGLLLTLLFPPLRICFPAQLRGLAIVFTPGRWRGLIHQFRS